VPENRFVGEIARTYDQPGTGMFADGVLEATVDCLVELADGGAAMEFAIGTGRVAVPLAARGVPVVGIELSADMLDVLRSKPEASGIAAVEGDMAVTFVEGEFSLVYLVFNTITNLTTQDEQVACFENAARHLRPGGRFVIETNVPGLRRLPPGNSGVAFALTEDYIGIDDFIDRTHKQISRSRHFNRLPDGSFREFTAPFRYVWPAELDLMARIASMTLEHRWGGGIARRSLVRALGMSVCGVFRRHRRSCRLVRLAPQSWGPACPVIINADLIECGRRTAPTGQDSKWGAGGGPGFHEAGVKYAGTLGAKRAELIDYLGLSVAARPDSASRTTPSPVVRSSTTRCPIPPGSVTPGPVGRFMTVPRTRAMFGTLRRCGQWDGRQSSSGVTTSLALSRSLAESPTTCGACASTGTSRSVVSVLGATLISRGRPSSSNTSTVKV
jgi:SAM-dependent methyltransferase